MSISSKAQATVIKRKVTPVIVYGSDQILPKEYAENFKKVIIYVQDWMKFWLGGKTFAFHDIVKLQVRLSNNELKSISQRSFLVEPPEYLLNRNPHRWDLDDAVRPELQKNNLSKSGEIYIVFVFAGKYGIDLKFLDPPQAYGEMYGWHIIIPPHKLDPNLILKFSPKNIPPIDPVVADLVYATAHQLGIRLGMSNTCTLYEYFMYNCGQSFMEYGLPPFMVMLPQEVDYLRSKREWIY